MSEVQGPPHAIEQHYALSTDRLDKGTRYLGNAVNAPYPHKLDLHGPPGR